MPTNPYAPPSAKVADVDAMTLHGKPMTEQQELKYLKLLLKQIDHGAPAALRSRLVVFGFSLLAAVLFMVISRLSERIPLFGVIGASCFIGYLLGFYAAGQLAARQWPSLRQHVSRESVVERINELDRH